mgnify:CR=1 FL=1
MSGTCQQKEAGRSPPLNITQMVFESYGWVTRALQHGLGKQVTRGRHHINRLGDLRIVPGQDLQRGDRAETRRSPIGIATAAR